MDNGLETSHWMLKVMNNPIVTGKLREVGLLANTELKIQLNHVDNLNDDSHTETQTITVVKHSSKFNQPFFFSVQCIIWWKYYPNYDGIKTLE